jgi:hypothetical protein
MRAEGADWLAQAAGASTRGMRGSQDEQEKNLKFMGRSQVEKARFFLKHKSD